MTSRKKCSGGWIPYRFSLWDRMPVISVERNAQCVPLLDPRALVCANMVCVVQHHFIHCLGAEINTATTLPKTSNTQTINLIYSEVLYPLKSSWITDMSMTCTWHTHTHTQSCSMGSSQANSSAVVFNPPAVCTLAKVPGPCIFCRLTLTWWSRTFA
jgi:hypothetical protein